MLKLRIRFIWLLLIWGTIVILFSYDLPLLNKFFSLWMGCCLSFVVLIITHYRYRKWGPEINNELKKLDLTLINERPLTIFESAQFADTRYFFEVVSQSFKRIITVEKSKVTKTLCIRISRNLLSSEIDKIEILGEV